MEKKSGSDPFAIPFKRQEPEGFFVRGQKRCER